MLRKREAMKRKTESWMVEWADHNVKGDLRSKSLKQVEVRGLLLPSESGNNEMATLLREREQQDGYSPERVGTTRFHSFIDRKSVV